MLLMLNGGMVVMHGAYMPVQSMHMHSADGISLATCKAAHADLTSLPAGCHLPHAPPTASSRLSWEQSEFHSRARLSHRHRLLA